MQTFLQMATPLYTLAHICRWNVATYVSACDIYYVVVYVETSKYNMCVYI
jgi:hypothetical protein